MSDGEAVKEKARRNNRALQVLGDDAKVASYFYRDFAEPAGFPESAIANCKALTRLTISGCNLEKIPEHLFNHTALTSVCAPFFFFRQSFSTFLCHSHAIIVVADTAEPSR